jgi:hypothetical protein
MDDEAQGSWRGFRRLLFAILGLVFLFALAWVGENLRGKLAWQKHRAEWEQKGERFDFKSLMPPFVPDEQNFALTPLLKPLFDFTHGPNGAHWQDTNEFARFAKLSAELPSRSSTNDRLVLGNLEKGTFADLSACGDFYRGNTNYPQAPDSATPAERVLAALRQFDPEIAELRDAAKTRPYSRFPIRYDYEPPWAILLPHLAHLKALTTLTQVHALAELDARQAGEAFDDLKLGLRLSASIDSEPILIDHLVRIATLGICLQTVREGLLRHAWTEQQLIELENSLASVNLLAEYKLAMHGERALSTAGMDYLRRQGFRSDAVNSFGSSDTGAPLNLMPGGWYYQNMLNFSRVFQEFTFPGVDEQARRVLPDLNEDAGKAVENMKTGPYTILAKMLLPAVQRAALKSARMQTYVDATRLACALERYRRATGKLPDTPDSLVPEYAKAIPQDVIDGKPLRYRLNPDDGFIIYSVGWNKTDDGGQLAWGSAKRDPGVDATQGDWVWQMPAK